MSPLKILHDITTARDNESPSLLRIVSLLISVEFLLWGAAAIYRGQQFSPEGFGTGAGLLVFAIGSALRISLPTNRGNDDWLATRWEGETWLSGSMTDVSEG